MKEILPLTNITETNSTRSRDFTIPSAEMREGGAVGGEVREEGEVVDGDAGLWAAVVVVGRAGRWGVAVGLA